MNLALPQIRNPGDHAMTIAAASVVPEIAWLAAFRRCFAAPVWNHIPVLVAGTVLAPGKHAGPLPQVMRRRANVGANADAGGSDRPQMLGRYRDGGAAELGDLSSARHTMALTTDADIATALLTVRRQRPT